MKYKDMNWPTNRVHDAVNSYGYLVIPWFGRNEIGKRNWLGYWDSYGWRVSGYHWFHNCTKTGVY